MADILGFCEGREARTFAPGEVLIREGGQDGKLYILQARPETVASRRSANLITEYTIEGHPVPRVIGRAVGQKVASGAVRVVRGPADLRPASSGYQWVLGPLEPGTHRLQLRQRMARRRGRRPHRPTASEHHRRADRVRAMSRRWRRAAPRTRR